MTEPGSAQSQRRGQAARPSRPKAARILAWAALIAVGAVLGGLAWCERGLSQSKLLAKHGLWREVHAPIARYLLLHPRDAEANLLCAEALSKDRDLPRQDQVALAVMRLRAVPDDSPDAARARVAEARVHLFLATSPTAAQEALKHALALEPDDVEANFLLWKLLTLTRRNELAEPYFWKVLEGTPQEERGGVLRDWYLSQFFPITSSMDLDGLMGFRATPADNSSGVESNRLVGFRGAEPGSPLCNAAMARWFQSEGDLRFALELLDKVAEDAPQAVAGDPFFAGTVVDVAIDLGEMERAAEAFDRWPEGDRGRDYWLARGRIEQEVRDDPAGAAESYVTSLGTWPGIIDWRTMHRAASCFARAGNQPEATLWRSRAAALEATMNDELHGRLRSLLARLDDPAALQAVVDFYQTIARPREAEAWSRYIEVLRKRMEGGGRGVDTPTARERA